VDEFRVQHSAFIVDPNYLMTSDGTLKITDFELASSFDSLVLDFRSAPPIL
jgi:hypothetical protein